MAFKVAEAEPAKCLSVACSSCCGKHLHPLLPVLPDACSMVVSEAKVSERFSVALFGSRFQQTTCSSNASF